MEIAAVDLYCALCPLEWILSEGHCATHEEPLINAWGCDQGLLWFTGASVTNSPYCVTWFNEHKSGWPSIRLTQHLHHCMTVGPLMCDCEFCWCMFVCAQGAGGFGCVDGVQTVAFAPFLPDFHWIWECTVNRNGHISGILFCGDSRCDSQRSTI